MLHNSIQSWPLHSQAAAVFLIFVGLIACTLVVIGPVFACARRLLPSGWFEYIAGMFWAVGPFYIVIGIFHFLSPAPFCARKIFTVVSVHVKQFSNLRQWSAVVPPPGTWGFWYIPGTAKFHVLWSGAVEVNNQTLDPSSPSHLYYSQSQAAYQDHTHPPCTHGRSWADWDWSRVRCSAYPPSPATAPSCSSR
jgi:hypothetical protein